MYYKRALKLVQGFELDSTGIAQGLVTATCKSDNEFPEFHKGPGNLLNRRAAIGFSMRSCFKKLRNYGGWNFEQINFYTTILFSAK